MFSALPATNEEAATQVFGSSQIAGFATVAPTTKAKLSPL